MPSKARYLMRRKPYIISRSDISLNDAFIEAKKRGSVESRERADLKNLSVGIRKRGNEPPPVGMRAKPA